MSGDRSRAAQDLIDDIAVRSGLAAEPTSVAVTLVAAFLSGSLGERRLTDLHRRIPEFGELASEGETRRAAIAAERAGGTLAGRLFASFGDLAGGDDGGPVARMMTLIGHLGRIGLGSGDMRALAGGMIGHVRERLGDDYVDTMVAKARARLPIIGRYLT